MLCVHVCGVCSVCKGGVCTQVMCVLCAHICVALAQAHTHVGLVSERVGHSAVGSSAAPPCPQSFCHCPVMPTRRSTPLMRWSGESLSCLGMSFLTFRTVVVE